MQPAGGVCEGNGVAAGYTTGALLWVLLASSSGFVGGGVERGATCEKGAESRELRHDGGLLASSSYALPVPFWT